MWMEQDWIPELEFGTYPKTSMRIVSTIPTMSCERCWNLEGFLARCQLLGPEQDNHRMAEKKRRGITVTSRSYIQKEQGPCAW